MSQTVFNSMELDAIGELMNISLGSSATAVSNMLDHRVDITTPRVQVVSVKDFSIGDLEPAIGIEIKYVSGLEGSNIMMLRRSDVKTIVDILMGSETPDEEFELNDMTISAVCEVMNQMMGAASTALSDFLGRPVNISTPESFALDNLQEFKKERFPNEDGSLVVVRFVLGIERVLQSEFVNVMSVELARDLLNGFEMSFDMGEPAPEPEPAPAPAPAPASGGNGAVMSQDEIEKLSAAQSGASAPAPAPASGGSGAVMSQDEIEKLFAAQSGASAPAPAPAPASGGGGAVMSQDEIEKLFAAQSGASAPAPAQPAMQAQPVMQTQPVMQAQPVMQMQQPVMQQPMMQGQPVMQQPVYMPSQPVYMPEPKVINSRPLQLSELDVEKRLGKEQADNLEMIMSVPLEISVEIGRTRRKVEDILALSKGSLVVLDKLAGDQVDLFVNGLCVARGDVVVIDDNFGVRITEVLRNADLFNKS